MIDNFFVDIFSGIPDPRVNRTRRHLFLDIIGLALCAVLAGAQGYTEIEDFCIHHKAWLQTYFILPNGIPSHDTFSRVFSAINPEAFQNHFLQWMTTVIHLFPEQVIALDGKSIRASRRTRKGLKALHIVSAWSCVNGMSLGQLAVDDKTNEITAIPTLLQTLCIKGAIITIDAMGCQKAIADHVIAQEADYVLRMKANQPTWHEALVHTFAHAQKINYQSMTYYTAQDECNNDHGRIESRQCITLPIMYLAHLKQSWRGLKSLVLLISQRETAEEKTIEYRYYISSLPPQNPQKIMHAIRDHWQIENNLHWCLDVVFREDQSRIRNENSALNLSWVRKTALALLKRATHIKGGIRRKQLAIWAKPQQLIDIVKI